MNFLFADLEIISRVPVQEDGKTVGYSFEARGAENRKSIRGPGNVLGRTLGTLPTGRPGTGLQDDELISVRSLSSSFPADHSGAILSYAQSFSLVEYLIDAHGWEKMVDFLVIFKEGSTPDKALQEVYGLDRYSLYQVRRQYVGAN